MKASAFKGKLVVLAFHLLIHMKVLFIEKKCTVKLIHFLLKNLEKILFSLFSELYPSQMSLFYHNLRMLTDMEGDHHSFLKSCI